MLRLIYFLLITLCANLTYAQFDLPEHRRTLAHYNCPKEFQASNHAKVAFFDADSTLRISKSKEVTATEEDDVIILPFVASKIKELNDRGYLVAIVSNQGGVKDNKEKFRVSNGALLFTIHQLARLGARVDYYDFAEFRDEKDLNKGFRKPAIRMATTLEDNLKISCKNQELKIDKEESFMVGDSDKKPDDKYETDRLFAENYKIDFRRPHEYFHWIDFGITDINHDIGDSNKNKKLNLLTERIETEIKRLKESNENPLREHELRTELTNFYRVNQLKSILRFVHFNIKELTTAKLTDNSNEQVDSATTTISGLNPDFLSLNEIQYDLPSIPTIEQPDDSTGMNVSRIIEKIVMNRELELPNWGYTFEEANTGRNAIKRDGVNYFEDPNDETARKYYADQFNFGVFPGEYSTGFASKFPIVKKNVFADIPWKTWNHEIDLKQFTLPNGDPLPENPELFDKNFNHSVVSVDGVMINFITFHTVPSHNFRSETSPNYLRNRDQLEFLKWYLTGECNKDIYNCDSLGISPLPKNALFIAVGDLNVDINSNNPGAEVLKSLYKHPAIQNWAPRNWDPKFKSKNITFLSDAFDKIDLGETSLQQQLDYFLISKHFNIVGGEVFVPQSEFREYGCFDNPDQAQDKYEEVIIELASQEKPHTVEVVSRWVKLFAGKKELFCVISTTKAFSDFRKGSDHLPIYVDLEVDNTF